MASQGVEALLAASSDCKFRLVRLLVEGGAPVDTRNTEQQTPIMLACKSNSINKAKEKVVQFLIKKSAKVNLRDVNGKTALMFACLSDSNVPIITSLMNASANPLIEDTQNNSALDYAISSGNLVTIKLLVDVLQKPNPNFGRGFHEVEMSDLEEHFANVQEGRKLSWPLMGNLRRFLTSRQRYKLTSEVQNSNTHRDVYSVADKGESETPHTQRQRKQSICHFEPIDIESILRANSYEEARSSNNSLTDSETTKLSELQKRAPRKKSVTRTYSGHEKISLHFSEDESDGKYTFHTPPRVNSLPSEKLLKRNSSFSSLSSGDSEDMTEDATISHPTVTHVNEARKNATAYGKGSANPHLDVDETNLSACNKSNVNSKADLEENPTNAIAYSNISLKTTKSYRRGRKNNERDCCDEWKAKPSTAVKPRMQEFLLPQSPSISPAVSPNSSPCMRRRSWAIYDFERNTSQFTNTPTDSPSRRYTTPIISRQRTSSPVNYGSDFNLSSLHPSGSHGSEAKSPIVRKKIIPTRIILEQELDIENKEDCGNTSPTAEADWLQTVATKNDEKKASVERGCDTNLSSNTQLPSLSKRPSMISLDKNVNLQHIELTQTSNENETKTTQVEVLNTILVTRCLPDGATPRRKSWMETSDNPQCFQPASEIAKQRSTSKCDIISGTTAASTWEKMESVHLKPKANPLPDLLSHSVSRPSYSAQPPSPIESKSHEENTFLNSCLEPTSKEYSARMTGNCSLPEVVCTARYPKTRQTSILPPLSVTTTVWK